MSVLITDSRNPSYVGSLATANGLYKADTYNIGMYSGTTLDLSTPRTIAITPTTGYNNNGVVLWVRNGGSNDRGIYAAIQENKGTATLTGATDLVTLTAHGFSAGQEITFSTAVGGVTANTVYYVIASGLTANDFKFSTTLGGSAFNITGTSATSTLWASRGSQTQTASTLFNGRVAADNIIWGNIVFVIPFTWTAYAVTAVAGTWRYYVARSGGTAGTLTLSTSDGTNACYADLTDIAATYADNTDQVIFKDQCDLSDGSYQLKRLSASVQICAVVCKSASRPTKLNNVATMFMSAPASARTLKIDGAVTISADGAVQIGTSASPITLTNKVTIDCNYKSAGTITSGFYSIDPNVPTYAGGYGSVICHGTVATGQNATLAATANAGTASCTTATDVSSWKTGDRVYVGKQNVIGLGSQTLNTLSGAPSWSGSLSTLNFTSNLLTNNRMGPASGNPGGRLVNIDGYSIIIKGGSTSVAQFFSYLGWRTIYLSGVLLQDCQGYASTNTAQYFDDGEITIVDCCIYAVTNPSYSMFFGLTPLPTYGTTPIAGATITRLNSIFQGIGGFLGVTGQGRVTWTDIYLACAGGVSNGLFWPYQSNDVVGCVIENVSQPAIWLSSFDVNISNIYAYGCSYGFYGSVIAFASNVVLATSGCKFDRSQIPTKFQNSQIWTSTNDSWGEETGNTTRDIAGGGNNPLPYGTTKALLTNPTFANSPTTSIETNLLSLSDPGSYLRIVNYNGTLNDCRSYYPNGYFASVSPSYASILAKTFLSSRTLENTYLLNTRSVSTFKILNKINVTIANAAFYAGTHTKPTLTVYDDDSTTPAGSSVATGSTSQQSLSVINTPSTDNNDITIVLSQKTDASEANSGVTWDSLVTNVRKYGYTFQSYASTIFKTTDTPLQVLTTPVANPYITVSNSATVAGYTEFTINHATQTVTITADTTLDRLYDYAQYDLTIDANMGYTEWLTTLDGTNFTSTYNITLNTGVDLTGGGTVDVGAMTFTRTGTATYDGIVITSTNRSVHTLLNGLVAGSTVQIYNTDDSTELYNAVVAGTSLDYLFTWTTDKAIRIRVRKVGYIPYEATGTIDNTGFSLNVSQEVDSVYNTNGIDGSTVTEFSLTGGVVGIFVDDPDNTTTGQRLYNWYMYAIATTGFIDDQSNLVTALTPFDYVLDDTLKIKNLDTVNSLAITGANIDNTSANGQIFDISNGASITQKGHSPASAPKQIWDFAEASVTASGSIGRKLKNGANASIASQ